MEMYALMRKYKMVKSMFRNRQKLGGYSRKGRPANRNRKRTCHKREVGDAVGYFTPIDKPNMLH